MQSINKAAFSILLKDEQLNNTYRKIFEERIKPNKNCVFELTEMVKEYAGEYKVFFNKEPFLKDLTFETCLWYAFIYMQQKTKTEFAALNSSLKTSKIYKDMKRMRLNRKYYIKSKIHKKYKTRGKDDLIYAYARTSSGVLDEVEKIKYSEIMSWAELEATLLSDYDFFSSLSSKKQVEFFMCDICIYLLDFIDKNWFGSLEGYVITPGYKAEDSIFNFNGRRKNMDIKFGISDSEKGTEIIAYGEHNYIPDPSDSELTATFRTIVASEEIENTELTTLTEDEKQLYAFNIANKKGWDVLSKPLVAEDADVYSFLFNKIRLGTFAGESITFTLGELFKFVYPDRPKPHRRQYELLISHFLRIGRYKLDYVESETGKRTGTLSLFETVIERNNERLEASKCIAYPSETTKSRAQAAKDMVVLTSIYKDMPTPKHRQFFILLQSLRLRNIGKEPFESYVPYNYFSSSLQLMELKPAALRKELKDYLNWFSENRIVIHNYSGLEANSNVIKLYYVPFNNIEEMIYNTSFSNFIDEKTSKVDFLDITQNK